VPVSAMKGDNLISHSAAMPWYSGKTVMEHLEMVVDPDAALATLPARMFVQDVYGEIIAGRLETGRLSAGDAIAIEPGGMKARIARMYIAGKEGKNAHAGQNVGIVIEPPAPVRRGCVCMPAAGSARPVRSIRAHLFCFGMPMKEGDEAELICAAQESKARIVRIAKAAGKRAVGNGSAVNEGADVELELGQPLVLERFTEMRATGRFVLSKGGRPVAAGVVL